MISVMMVMMKIKSITWLFISYYLKQLIYLIHYFLQRLYIIDYNIVFIDIYQEIEDFLYLV